MRHDLNRIPRLQVPGFASVIELIYGQSLKFSSSSFKRPETIRRLSSDLFRCRLKHAAESSRHFESDVLSKALFHETEQLNRAERRIRELVRGLSKRTVLLRQWILCHEALADFECVCVGNFQKFQSLFEIIHNEFNEIKKLIYW